MADSGNRLLDLMAEDDVGRAAPPANFVNGWPQPGAWQRLLGPQGEDFVTKALTYAPLGARSAGGRTMGNDAIIARRLDPRRDNEPDHIGGGAAIDGLRPSLANSEILSQIGGRHMQSAESGPFDSTHNSAMAENYMAAPRRPGPSARDRMSSERPYWSQRAPDNFNAPRQPELTSPSAGRMMQAIDNGGKPPTVELKPSSDLVQRYLDALTTGTRRRGGLTVIPGGKD